MNVCTYNCLTLSLSRSEPKPDLSEVAYWSEVAWCKQTQILLLLAPRSNTGPQTPADKKAERACMLQKENLSYSAPNQ